MRALTGVVLAITFLSAPASAVTVEELVAMTKAGVSDEVLLALIERDKTIFPLDSRQLIALRAAGVSESVMLAMLRNGYREPEPAPAAQSPTPATLPASEGPIVAVVGHGPDRPNGYGSWDPIVPMPPVFYGVPYIVGAWHPGCQVSVPSSGAIYEASQKFVNSTLFSMLDASSGAGGCRPARHLPGRRHR